MTFFKVFFRRYSIYAFLFIPLEVFLLVTDFNTVAFGLLLSFLGFISYRVFKFGDELRSDIIFFSVIKEASLKYRLLLLLFFSFIVSVPYLSVNSFISVLKIFDFISLFILFFVLSKIFIYKKIFYLLFVLFILIDLAYKLGYSSLSQNNIFYSIALLISHIILLSLLLKQYKETLWKHLII